jgi:hypothetical protein
MKIAWHRKRTPMNAKTIFLLFLVGIVGDGCRSFAQRSKPALSPPSPRADYKIVTKNETRNGDVITIVSLERMSIASPDAADEPIGFSSMFAYDQKSQAVPAAYISFYSLAPKCRFPYKAEVIFVADGENIRVGDDPGAAKRGEATAISLSERGGDRCKESLDVILPQRVYFSIAKAQMVEVQFGELRFRLNENHLNALRELGRRMAAPKP